MAQTWKRSRRGTGGFRNASALVEGNIRRAGEARGFATARLLTHWPEVVGAELAAISRPVKVGFAGHGLGATLTVQTSGAAAPILQMQLDRMRARINACYGYAAIARIRLVQSSATSHLATQTNEAPARDKVGPIARKRADDLAADVSDPDLRAALARLGANVMARAERRAAERAAATD
jgi:hypothetical protein